MGSWICFRKASLLSRQLRWPSNNLIGAATTGCAKVFLDLAQSSYENCGAFFCLTLCSNALYIAVRPTSYRTLEGDRTMSKPESILGSLPSLNLITNVEKLDAGLRGLDHCELLLQIALVTCGAKLATRQDEASIMALHASSTTYSYSTLGDATFSSHPAERAMSSS